MATWEDVRRLALALPETHEDMSREKSFWRVRDKGFVWERPLRKSDLKALGESAPAGPILGARVEHLVAKEAPILSRHGCAVVLSTGPVITARAVSVLGAATPQATGLPSLKLRQNIEWVERETIRRALDHASGVKKDAAELMGISQRALSYYLAKYRFD